MYLTVVLMNRFSPRRLVSHSTPLILAAAAWMGCGGGDLAPSASVVLGVTRVEVTPSSLTIDVNESQQLTALGYDSQGRVVPGISASFSSDNVAIANVTGSGLV